MSYAFTIRKDGAGLHVEHADAEHIPDGKFLISGHEDDTYRSIGIVRTTAASGTTVIQAGGGSAR